MPASSDEAGQLGKAQSLEYLSAAFHRSCPAYTLRFVSPELIIERSTRLGRRARISILITLQTRAEVQVLLAMIKPADAQVGQVEGRQQRYQSSGWPQVWKTTCQDGLCLLGHQLFSFLARGALLFLIA